MNIAIVLIHNKSALQNVSQINALKSRLTEVRELDVDENGLPILDEETGLQTTHLIGYEIGALALTHLIKVYQIIPFGVTPPTNLYALDSHKVFYGAGDEDKTGTHPRFFNWGLKRSTDYGADIVLYASDVANVDTTDLRTRLSQLSSGSSMFAEAAYGKISHVNLLRRIGQLDETKNFNTAITDLKNRIANWKGLHG